MDRTIDLHELLIIGYSVLVSILVEGICIVSICAVLRLVFRFLGLSNEITKSALM